MSNLMGCLGHPTREVESLELLQLRVYTRGKEIERLDSANMQLEDELSHMEMVEITQQAKIKRLQAALQYFVTSYDDWLGRQDGSPTIDLAENAKKLLIGGES